MCTWKRHGLWSATSLQLTTDNRVLQHVAAFALAWIVASFIFIYALRPIVVLPPQPGYHIRVLGKGETATQNLIYLAGALRGGDTIVILGSSELDRLYSSGIFIPTVFFPGHHLASVLTYGRPGFESLGMYGLLSALKPHLNVRTRLVIMLSPAWFRTTDMQPQIFNDNFNDNTLLQLYLNDDQRGVIHDYLVSHEADFSSMTTTQRMFLNDPSSMVDLDLPLFVTDQINSRAYGLREKLNLRLAQLGQPDTEPMFGTVHTQDLPWDRYESLARAREVAGMKNNAYWVRNWFYNMMIKKYKTLPIAYFPKDMQPEPEMNALKLLLQLLHRNKVKALFIMQPVNPRIYNDLATFDEVDARITNLCREYGMQYMDIYNQPYEQGILRDGSHPGELGWERIDRQIAEYFQL
jgi:D-alanine transfer protein